MNILDRAIASVFPVWGLRRASARMRFGAIRKLEAVEASRNRKTKASKGSGDVVANQDAAKMREIGRNLEENYDVAAGILSTLVDNVVGAGIQTFPMARTRTGELFTELNQILDGLFKDWVRAADVTGEYHYYGAQRLEAWSTYRDGEVFQQNLTGMRPGLVQVGDVPFWIELIESDYVPFVSGRLASGVEVRHGVQKNAWGRPLAYYVHKTHPAETLLLSSAPSLSASLANLADLKETAAENMLHLKIARRIKQTRGVSVLASVATRLADLKDYEEAERVAAKIGASVALAITKQIDVGDPTGGTGAEDRSPRELDWMPGIIFDNLQDGEKVESIRNERPSNQFRDFRSVCLRSAAGGTGAGFSSISKEYTGTYSAQRQELVEQQVHYAVMTEDFVSRLVRPTYRRFVGAAMLANQIPDELLADADLRTVSAAAYRGPGVAYIDPLKEVKAELTSVQAGFRSKASVILAHGGNPEEVEREIESERGRDEAAEIVHTSNPKWNQSDETDDTTDDGDNASEAEAA